MWYAKDRLVSGVEIRASAVMMSNHGIQGPERVKNLYAFRTIIDAGARITLGSDFPVEDMNPLSGFHAAVTRVSSEGRSPHGPGGWYGHSPCFFLCLNVPQVSRSKAYAH